MIRAFRAGVAVLASAFLVTSFVAPAAAEEPPADPTGVATATLADQIAEAAEDGASTADELAESVGLPPAGPNSLDVTDDGRVAVTITFTAAPTDADVARVAEIATVDQVFSFSPAIAATVDPIRLPEIGELPGVTSVAPVLAPVVGSASATRVATEPLNDPADSSCRAIPVEADGPLRTALARETFGVDGTGVTIGVISDSFETPTGDTTPEEEVLMGVLPGPGNPCGYETPVEVLVDDPTQSGEGRGMAQLVHGIAPGARILFASGWGGANQMAESIHALAEAGADVIVDDLGYATNTYFQPALLASAINTVRADGVAYYSSAGNANAIGADGTPSEGLPIAAWQTTAFRGTACPTWVVIQGLSEFDCLDFDPGQAEDPTESIGLNGRAEPRILSSWGEPINGVSSQLVPLLYTTDSVPAPVGVSALLDQNVPNRLMLFQDGTPPAGEYQLVVVRVLTDEPPASPALWMGAFAGSGAISWREYDRSAGVDVVGPVTFGHAADGSATGVAAADWLTPDEPESFTSPGPGRMLFEPYDPTTSVPAAPLAEPLVVQAPKIAGVDGTRTSFFGRDVGGDYRFYGTSAAAPHVAAVHVLAAQFAPDVSADRITELMQETASEMENPFDGILPDADVFGAGLVDGYALLDRLPAAAVDALTATALSATSIAAEWTGIPAGNGYQVELLRGDTVVEVGTLDPGVTATTFAGLTPETTYRVRVAALNSASEPGAWVQSSDVRTPRPAQPANLPPAPAESALTPPSAGGLVATPDRVRAGEHVTVSGLPGSAWVAGWAYSTPTSLGWGWVGADGSASFTIPADLPAGAHRIAVTDAAGELLGWVDVTVLADAAVPAATSTAGLAKTGVDVAPIALGGVMLLIIAGAALIVMSRRRA